MKYRALLAAAVLGFTAQVAAKPAMSIVTINTEDPVGYMKWAQGSGPAIGNAIDAFVGGVCMADAGFYAPGEVYYWHLFRDLATAMGASVYNDSVRKEAGKLKVKRTVSRSDILSLEVGEEPVGMNVGDTFSNWDLVVSSKDVALYGQQLNRISDEASKHGFADISVSSHTYLTGEHAGDMLVQIVAPSNTRLGAFLDHIDSDWMAPIMAGLSSIREYERGFLVNCTVTYVKGN